MGRLQTKGFSEKSWKFKFLYRLVVLPSSCDLNNSVMLSFPNFPGSNHNGGHVRHLLRVGERERAGQQGLCEEKKKKGAWTEVTKQEKKKNQMEKKEKPE